MKWYHQIRWKLFAAHLVILIVAVVALLTTANIIAGVGLVEHVSIYPTATPEETDQLQHFQFVVQESLIVAAFAALAAAAVMSIIVSRGIVEPLQAMTHVSRLLSQGFYRERIAVASDDELAELSHSVNRLAESLEQTEQQRMALLADVTHELRTPLTTIEGYMEGLIDGVVQPNEQTFTLILNESTRLKRLIEDLELLSRAEAGQIKTAPRAIDVQPLLQNLVMQFQPQFQAREIRLTLILPSMRLPAAWGDPDRVGQILINLLSNALRYTPSGGRVTVQVWGEEKHIVIAVADTGIGIAPEHLPHIFERFYRVDKSRSRASGGSGIGLTVASHLAYAQGGELRAASKGVGRGSTFSLVLPWASEPAAEQHAPGDMQMVA